MWSDYSKSLQTRADSIDREKEIIKNKILMKDTMQKTVERIQIFSFALLMILKIYKYTSTIEINS